MVSARSKVYVPLPAAVPLNTFDTCTKFFYILESVPKRPPKIQTRLPLDLEHCTTETVTEFTITISSQFQTVSPLQSTTIANKQDK
jgi:hypothetical protein